MYQLTIAPRAVKMFHKADAPLQRKLDRCFEQLKKDPHRHNNIKALHGPFVGKFRYRVGDYRVVYYVDEPAKMVYVSMIAHRRDVYE